MLRVGLMRDGTIVTGNPSTTMTSAESLHPAQAPADGAILETTGDDAPATPGSTPRPDIGRNTTHG
jgi:hypothetical protein